MDFKTAVLDILKNDAGIAPATIAAMLGKTEAEVNTVVDELKNSGVILRSAALVNTEAMGEDAPAEAMIGLKVMPQREFGYDDIARRVYLFPEVKALYLMSGRYDLLVKIESKTMKDISRFVWEKLSVLDGVSSTETLFIMRKYKEYGSVLCAEDQGDRLVVTA